MLLSVRIKYILALVLLLGSTLAQAQISDKVLFQKFENHFALLDSLIFGLDYPVWKGKLPHRLTRTLNPLYSEVDSLLFEKVEKQMEAMKAETGLLISGQSYYRLDEGFGIDDEDALSRYTAKVQVELRWNFLSSSLINRRSRLNELDIKGELERVGLERERIGKLI